MIEALGANERQKSRKTFSKNPTKNRGYKKKRGGLWGERKLLRVRPEIISIPGPKKTGRVSGPQGVVMVNRVMSGSNFDSAWGGFGVLKANEQVKRGTKK